MMIEQTLVIFASAVFFLGVGGRKWSIVGIVEFNRLDIITLFFKPKHLYNNYACRRVYCLFCLFEITFFTPFNIHFKLFFHSEVRFIYMITLTFNLNLYVFALFLMIFYNVFRSLEDANVFLVNDFQNPLQVGGPDFCFFVSNSNNYYVKVASLCFSLVVQLLIINLVQ